MYNNIFIYISFIVIFNIIDIYPRKFTCPPSFTVRGHFQSRNPDPHFPQFFFKDSGSAWPSQSPPNDDLSKKFGKRASSSRSERDMGNDWLTLSI